eukprot:7035994-Heterocapsa_arctica.AAC.1
MSSASMPLFFTSSACPAASQTPDHACRTRLIWSAGPVKLGMRPTTSGTSLASPKRCWKSESVSRRR